MMNKKGITLIELIVVVGILGILLTMGTFNYKRLMVKANIEKDTRQILAVTNRARQYSFTRKINLFVKVNGKSITVEDADDAVYGDFRLNTGTEFVTDDDIAFSDGFVVATGMIRASVLNSGAEFDCVSFEANRIKTGKFDGENCDVR
jgi:prepilin-type N-terminal cleavage/methylation domain-containing protein